LFLMDTALLSHQFWSRRAYNLAPELRLRLGSYGVTPADRARLRVRVTRPDPSVPLETPGVPNLASRRSRLTPPDVS
jgi:hypothetical protein